MGRSEDILNEWIKIVIKKLDHWKKLLIEVQALYEVDPTENVKGGFFDMFKEDPEVF